MRSSSHSGLLPCCRPSSSWLRRYHCRVCCSSSRQSGLYPTALSVVLRPLTLPDTKRFSIRLLPVTVSPVMVWLMPSKEPEYRCLKFVFVGIRSIPVRSMLRRCGDFLEVNHGFKPKSSRTKLAEKTDGKVPAALLSVNQEFVAWAYRVCSGLDELRNRRIFGLYPALSGRGNARPDLEDSGEMARRHEARDFGNLRDVLLGT